MGRVLVIALLLLAVTLVYAGGMFFRDESGAIANAHLRTGFALLFLGLLGGLGYALVSDSIGWRPLFEFVAIALITVLLVEAGVEVLMDHPRLLGGRPSTVLRQYNFSAETRAIQFMPECARYDPDLFYTLRPGTCRFENHEFSVEVRANSLGVRDDERSLDQPEVVVLGDSYAMGWGVEQDQSFSERIEAQTGLKVLNTAIASYGTVREFRMLGRVSLEKLRYLIIQYCENDFTENEEYLRTGSLEISDEKAYRDAVRWYEDAIRYYPGKHTYNVLGLLQTRLALALKPYFPAAAPRPEAAGAPPAGGQARQPRQARGLEDVDAFLHVVQAAPLDLSRVKIIVLDPPDRFGGESRFIRGLRTRLAQASSERLKNVIPVDLSGKLSADDFFVLDFHFNAQGHRKIADALVGVIRSH